MGHQINATDPEVGVCFHTDLKVKWVYKDQVNVWSKEWKGIFLFQLLELGYERFPYITTGQGRIESFYQPQIRAPSRHKKAFYTSEKALTEEIEKKLEESNPRLAEVLTINPKYI